MNVDYHGKNLLILKWWTKMIDFKQCHTPCYVVDENRLIDNLKILKSVKDQTGCKILLATKAFSMYSTFKLIGKYLDGVTSSGLYEAKLGREEMNKEVHVFSPAYRQDEIEEILEVSDHIVFNSAYQYHQYAKLAKSKGLQCGLRINPEYSEIETELYDPCASKSRLGIKLEDLKDIDFTNVDGLHFHAMCEQNADVLARIIKVVDEKFEPYLRKVKWLNFGGGHHITKKGYDIKTLVDTILYMKNKYDIEIYLEPGEAIALNAGYLVSSVLDIVHNEMDIAILDTSATCHMPDVLEMPYRPPLVNGFLPNESEFTYRLAGPTCLAGDVIGDYSFKQPLNIGDLLIFEDMAIYTMVKNNTFNGMPLPTIYLYTKHEEMKLIKSFGYEDFKRRL